MKFATVHPLYLVPYCATDKRIRSKKKKRKISLASSEYDHMLSVVMKRIYEKYIRNRHINNTGKQLRKTGEKFKRLTNGALYMPCCDKTMS